MWRCRPCLCGSPVASSTRASPSGSRNSSRRVTDPRLPRDGVGDAASSTLAATRPSTGGVPPTKTAAAVFPTGRGDRTARAHGAVGLCAVIAGAGRRAQPAPQRHPPRRRPHATRRSARSGSAGPGMVRTGHPPGSGCKNRGAHRHVAAAGARRAPTSQGGRGWPGPGPDPAGGDAGQGRVRGAGPARALRFCRVCVRCCASAATWLSPRYSPNGQSRRAAAPAYVRGGARERFGLCPSPARSARVATSAGRRSPGVSVCCGTARRSAWTTVLWRTPAAARHH